MFKASKLIRDALIEKGFPADAIQVHEYEEYCSVAFPLPVEGASMQELQFANTDDDNDVAIRVFSLVSSVPDSRRQAVLEAINKCNNKFRYAKFVLDKDGDVNAEYDFPVEVSDDCIAKAALEVGLMRFHSILADAYPILMRAMWA